MFDWENITKNEYSITFWFIIFTIFLSPHAAPDQYVCRPSSISIDFDQLVVQLFEGYEKKLKK